jgi:hypothetical protein
MFVILMTKCGCTRTVEIPSGSCEYVMPIKESSPFPARTEELGRPVKVSKRVFRQTHGNTPIPIFVEV